MLTCNSVVLPYGLGWDLTYACKPIKGSTISETIRACMKVRTSVTTCTYELHDVYVRVLRRTRTSVTKKKEKKLFKQSTFGFTVCTYLQLNNLYVRVFRRVSTNVTTCTYECYDVCVRMLRRVHTSVTTYTYECYDVYIRVLRRVHTSVTTCTCECYDVYVRVLRRVRTSVTTCTYECYDVYIRVLRRVLTTLGILFKRHTSVLV